MSNQLELEIQRVVVDHQFTTARFCNLGTVLLFLGMPLTEGFNSP